MLHAVPPGDSPPPLCIVDTLADAVYRASAPELGLPANNFWVADYVEYELRRSRHLFASGLLDVRGKSVLEFGCNVGATAIVLAHLGARVSAIDVNPRVLRAADLNARRYGVADQIRFEHVADTTRLPFPAHSFDVVSCNSVLEYVPPDDLPVVLDEIDRVLAPGGHVAILGTSNRIYPKELHSDRWLVNYLPRSLDRFLPARHRRRGVTPWELRRAFDGYEDLGLRDGGRPLLDIRAAMGVRGGGSRAVAAVARAASRFGVSIGMLLPWIVLVLRKPEPGVATP